MARTREQHKRTTIHKGVKDAQGLDGKNKKKAVRIDLTLADPSTPVEFVCACKKHTGQLKCDREQSLKFYREITTKLIATSDAITIVEVGTGHSVQKFGIHTELLLVHLPHIRDRIQNGVLKLDSDGIDASSFAVFQSWLYTGTSIAKLVPGSTFNTPDAGERDAELGAKLKSPGFQNFVMNDNLRDYKVGPDHWMTPMSIASVFKATKRHDKLRHLVLDVMNALFPRHEFEREAAFREDAEEWEKLCKKHKILQALEKRPIEVWGDERPWDYQHRQEYMLDEISLEQLWENHINLHTTKTKLHNLEQSDAAKEPQDRTMTVRDKIELTNYRRGEFQVHKTNRKTKLQRLLHRARAMRGKKAAKTVLGKGKMTQMQQAKSKTQSKKVSKTSISQLFDEDAAEDGPRGQDGNARKTSRKHLRNTRPDENDDDDDDDDDLVGAGEKQKTMDRKKSSVGKGGRNTSGKLQADQSIPRKGPSQPNQSKKRNHPTLEQGSDDEEGGGEVGASARRKKKVRFSEPPPTTKLSKKMSKTGRRKTVP